MSNRRNELAKIHIAAKQLGMDPADKSPDSSYRTMLWTAARVRSSSDLDEFGRQTVIEHLRKCGAKFTKPKRTRRPHNYDRLPEYVTKVEALLADMGLPWSYADTVARNITGGNGGEGKDPGVERLAWVTNKQHWRDIIAALSVEQEKRSLLARVEELLQELGLGHDYVEGLVAKHPRAGKWMRYRPLLKFIITTLNGEKERLE